MKLKKKFLFIPVIGFVYFLIKCTQYGWTTEIENPSFRVMMLFDVVQAIALSILLISLFL